MAGSISQTLSLDEYGVVFSSEGFEKHLKNAASKNRTALLKKVLDTDLRHLSGQSIPSKSD